METHGEPIATDKADSNSLEPKERIEVEKPKILYNVPTQAYEKYKDVLEEMKVKGIKLDYRYPETLRFLHVEKRLSTYKIAKLLGTRQTNVWYRLRSYGINIDRGTEPLTQMELSTITEQAVRVRKVNEVDGLFRVRNLENQSVSYLVDLDAKTCNCPLFTNQRTKCKHIELVEKALENRRQKNIKSVMKYQKKRYHFDPEFRRKTLERGLRWRLKQEELLKKFKMEYGGKCALCEERDLDLIDPHHIHGRRERYKSFIHTKEFRDWVNYGIKTAEIVLLCVKHHRKVKRMKGALTSNNIN